MTPTEIKAEKLAKELIDITIGLIQANVISNTELFNVEEAAKGICIRNCEFTIDALNSIKGMGKIHKVKLWKMVKAKIEAL